MNSAFQRNILEYATGPQSDISQYVSKPPTPFAMEQCYNQIMRRNRRMNFSILAKFLIFVGDFFSLYDCLGPAIRKHQQKPRDVQLKNPRRGNYALLQVQLIGCEANNLGTCKALEYSLVPVTTLAEVFDFREADGLHTATSDEELAEVAKPTFTVKRKA